MKKILFYSVAVLLAANLMAQAPQKMSYQAVIRDSSNEVVVNGQVGMRVSILQGSTSGSVVYSETLTPTTNANGLVSLEIGNGVGFSEINWTNGPFFIKTETDPFGGTNYSIIGTSQILSVPYAIHAKTAESITGSGATNRYVGELYGGGIVVAVWKTNGVEHGLIASLTDLSAGTAWSNITTAIGTGAGSATNGQQNTLAIINQAGHTASAALLCANYNAGGYSWYLPAVWELNLCYNAAPIVNAVIGDTDGFQFAYYWSSTESYDGYAGFQYFDYGSTGYADKDITYVRVRAVRRF